VVDEKSSAQSPTDSQRLQVAAAIGNARRLWRQG
jgi:hypothetical protein